MGDVSTHSPPSRLPIADPERTARLREALLAADFTADGLLDLLGGPAYAALARSETVPALRATRGDSPLEILVRLFLLQQPVPHERAREALPVDGRLDDGWLVRDGAEVRATVDVRPYGGPEGQDWWIVSDLGCAVGGAGGIGGPAAPGGRGPLARTSSSASAAPPRRWPASPCATPVAPRPRPRHRLRHPGAARRPARHPRDRDRPQSARPALRPAHPRAVRRAGAGSAGGLALRAGRRTRRTT